MNWPSQCAVIIPCLNESAAIGQLVADVRRQLPHVIVIDDGSSDDTADLASAAGASVIRHPTTQGKGTALTAGWRQAVKDGYPWALCMDGDGQHAPSDIPQFLAAGLAADLVVGNRMSRPLAMPWLRRQVNGWMSRRLSALAGIPLPDSQCGFRLMKLAAWAALPVQARHFEIESELSVQFALAGHGVEFVPIEVIYKAERSKIRPLLDSWRWFRWWHQMRRLVRTRQHRPVAKAPVSTPAVS